MFGTYILKGKQPVPATMEEWAEWYEKADRVVGQTNVSADWYVSTVFLGIDHNHSQSSAPVLFETMVFGPDGSYLDHACVRYCGWDEAMDGHERMVDVVTDMLLTPDTADGYPAKSDSLD
jgi:hypothetical protein